MNRKAFLGLVLWASASLVCVGPAVAGPFDQAGLHGAPRGPLSPPQPNPPPGTPSQDFFRQLIQSKWEMNMGGNTILMTIHKFTPGAPRPPVPTETSAFAVGGPVHPFQVEWTNTSYGQTSDVTQEYRQVWICWKNDVGQWEAGSIGMATTGELQSKDHPSI